MSDVKPLDENAPTKHSLAPVGKKSMTVGEAIQFSRDLKDFADEEILLSLLQEVGYDGGEANPEYQRFKILLRNLCDRLSETVGGGIVLHDDDAEKLYEYLTA
jgi:hypothetical protein